jgi:hypothetical protein
MINRLVAHFGRRPFAEHPLCGLQRVDIINHADFIDTNLMIADVMHVHSILGSCAENRMPSSWC